MAGLTLASFCFIMFFYHGMLRDEAADSRFFNVPASELVVFTATRYPDIDDVRCRQSIETLSNLRSRGITTVVVDSSPQQQIRDLLASTGALVYKQSVAGKKGAALREGADIAAHLPGVTPQTWLCWQEPEKSDMFRHWPNALLRNSQTADADVVVPYRDDQNFQETYDVCVNAQLFPAIMLYVVCCDGPRYPIEQYHSETYGNMYLDAVARDALRASNTEVPAIDWHFGPFAFRAKHVQLWTKFDGAM